MSPFYFIHIFSSFLSFFFVFFFFNDTATTEIYTLSLHDALPICDHRPPRAGSITSSLRCVLPPYAVADRKSTRLNSSHVAISYALFCLKKKQYPCARRAQYRQERGRCPNRSPCR